MKLHSPKTRAAWFGAIASAAIAMLPAASTAAQSEASLREQAIDAMKRAATAFRSQASSHGGYVYYVSLDGKQHVGEGIATEDQIFTEPPGTPAVGRAYLEAYHATGDTLFLDAAKDAGYALAHGQLKSGGWSQRIDFDPKGSHAGLYRNGKGNPKGRNHSSLDDNQTQSSTQFMARLDGALGFKDPVIHDAAQYALDSLIKAQFANGGFPQGWSEPSPEYPVLRASYPKEWPRLWPHEPYHKYYTLNDGLSGTVSDTLATAYEVYKDERYKVALARLGDFLILAQMPDPQPAWCQQYNFEMQPTWARKFEPPAISGLESEDAMKTLMKIYRVTGDKKYLAPIPKALRYLRTCVLPEGKLARYYELETNRPLYMTRKPGVSGNSNAPGYYDFTYSDKNLPDHYGWKQEHDLPGLAREYNELRKQEVTGEAKVLQRFTPLGKLEPIDPTDPMANPNARDLEPEVRRILKELDTAGRWVSTASRDGKQTERLVGQPKFKKGFQFLASNTFNYNMEILSLYVAATSGK